MIKFMLISNHRLVYKNKYPGFIGKRKICKVNMLSVNKNTKNHLFLVLKHSIATLLDKKLDFVIFTGYYLKLYQICIIETCIILNLIICKI